MSLAAGPGLFNVATGTVGVPPLRSYTYALPASLAPVSSPFAPTTTRVPEIATELPKESLAAGPGLFNVATGTVGVPPLDHTHTRSRRRSLPCHPAAPTTTRVPEIATE